MQTKEINGKTISSTFNTAIANPSQYIKPRAIIDFQDARHLKNVTITTNESPSSNIGDLNYYFSKEDILNFAEYETFSWGVCDAIDNDGNIISASGKYVALPSNLEENYKYGWWSVAKTDGTKTFTTSPSLDINFTATTLNKIKIVTSSGFGQINQFILAVSSASLGTVLSGTYSFNTSIDQYEKIINLDQTYTDINRIVIFVQSTKYANDYARILSVSPLYQVDISDYIISCSSNRVRDLHETSLPIAGSSQTSASITLDNTSKLFNALNSSSTYGKFLNKDVRIKLSNGWKTNLNAPDGPIEASLTTALNASGDTYLYAANSVYFPSGDIGNTGLESNYFILTVDEGRLTEEKILIKKKITDSQFEIQQRGYAGTDNVAHSVGATVRFDPFEYINIGTFFIEEISSGSSDMTVTLNCQDQFKFLNEKIIEKGIFIQDSTVPDAISTLLLSGNFPKKDIVKYHRFSDWPAENSAIFQLKFDDTSKNIANTSVWNGVRYRVYQPPVGSEATVKDMKLDAREIELSDLDKAMGIPSSINPTYVDNKAFINLSGYNLTTDNVSLRDTYYQGVFDGFFIPTTTQVAQEIGLYVNHGGARLYVDDVQLIDAWNEVSSLTYYSKTLDLTAGNPYKIRVEFYHTTSTLDLQLTYTAARTVIPSAQLLTNVFDDNIGSKNFSNTAAIPSRLKNYAVPSIYANLSQPSSISWNTTDSSVYLQNLNSNTTVQSFVRIPYNSTLNPTDSSIYLDKDWSIEILFKAPNGAFGGQGEYISNWGNSAPTTGFEFFYISSTNHGFKVKTNAAGTPTITVSSTTAMPNSGTGWNHIIATYSNYLNKIDYYVNGVLHATASGGTGTPVFGTTDITIGGRASSFTSGVGVVKPTFSGSIYGPTLYVDEFTIYKQYITSTMALRRYIETQIVENRKYPFLYGFNESIYQAIQNISFADLGRVYLDETNKAVIENYYSFFESSIDQHANSQQTFSDSSYIVNANYTKTLQVNSVIVKISGMASRSVGYQPIWRAPDNSTLGVVPLTANITSSDTSASTSGFDLVPFPKSGYFIIDNEVIKYSSTDSTSFKTLERGVFGTTAASHNTSSLIREVRWYDFQYDKSPAFGVKNPFITGILFEDPDEIQIVNWDSTAFKGNLIIAASNNVAANTVVFAEGTNPVTQKVAYTSVAGIPVQSTENTGQIKEQKAINTENRRRYGLKEVTIDNPFITDATVAQNLADFIIAKLSEPIPIIEIETILTPKVQVGDRITISSLDQFDIINTDYWVMSLENEIGSGYSQRMTIRKVV